MILSSQCAARNLSSLRATKLTCLPLRNPYLSDTPSPREFLTGLGETDLLVMTGASGAPLSLVDLRAPC